jgi:hypothetical protein
VVLPMDNVQWGEKCDKGRMIFAGSYGNRKLRVLEVANQRIYGNVELMM